MRVFSLFLCARQNLKCVASNASLTFEELATLFAQIENILNSRPFSPLSTDTRDPSLLNPGNFLIGWAMMSLPSVAVSCKHPHRSVGGTIATALRDRWRLEFDAELQQRTKWRTRQAELQKREFVLLKEQSLPPIRWYLARVDQLHQKLKCSHPKA